MADNVRFLTNNGTAGVGYSGCNGFPFAHSTGSVPDYQHPFIVSFKDDVKMWWRAKNWTVTSDMSVTNGSGTTTISAGTLTTNAANAGTELDLIFPRTHRFDKSSAHSSIDLDIFNTNNIIKSGSNEYPYLLMAAGVTTPDSGAGITIRYFDPDPGLGSATGSITGTVMGTSHTVYYWLQGSPTGFNLTSFDLEPVEYWPYAQLSDGLPIYNTSTGAVIGGRSPLN